MADGCTICEHGRHGLSCPYCESAPDRAVLVSELRSLRARLADAGRERDSHWQRVYELREQLDSARAATAEWERAYQGALADEKRARRAALEEAARLVADWPGIPNQQDVADAIRDLAGVTP
jgi:hypothetical protein